MYKTFHDFDQVINMVNNYIKYYHTYVWLKSKCIPRELMGIICELLYQDYNFEPIMY